MLKSLIIGIWASIVSLGTAFGIMILTRPADVAQVTKSEKKLEEYRTKAINVPVIGSGTIQGYMVAQFVFTVDANELKKIQVNPEVYVLDEAFKTIYSGEQINFQNMKKQDLSLLAKKLGDNVNKRLGLAIVQDVLIDQLSYIPKKDMRGAQKS